MGIKRLSQYPDYWSSHPVLGTPELVKGMLLNCFKMMLTNIHFSDNEQAVPRGSPGFDKLFKVRPILERILEKCNALYNQG